MYLIHDQQQQEEGEEKRKRVMTRKFMVQTMSWTRKQINAKKKCRGGGGRPHQTIQNDTDHYQRRGRNEGEAVAKTHHQNTERISNHLHHHLLDDRILHHFLMQFLSSF